MSSMYRELEEEGLPYLNTTLVCSVLSYSSSLSMAFLAYRPLLFIKLNYENRRRLTFKLRNKQIIKRRFRCSFVNNVMRISYKKWLF